MCEDRPLILINNGKTYHPTANFTILRQCENVYMTSYENMGNIDDILHQVDIDNDVVFMVLTDQDWSEGLNGTEVMEMDKVGDSGSSTTTYEDKNEELPGTASMLFLPKKRFQPVYTFGQLLPACTFPLAPTNTAETPFLVMLYGGLEVRAPKQCGLVKNISYTGGLY